MKEPVNIFDENNKVKRYKKREGVLQAIYSQGNYHNIFTSCYGYLYTVLVHILNIYCSTFYHHCDGIIRHGIYTDSIIKMVFKGVGILNIAYSKFGHHFAPPGTLMV